ncbi:MAG: 4-hydroxythreonine-4-phosphate dehydrogenase PdxA [Candidatus Omnitrophica bacterium]|nr:4-hydroxythreonine-4-phosphate dehydrogenase PdxA [Candidatus Omnitrophota bacterium]
MQKKLCVGITMGDPSGIGPEVSFEAIKRLSHKARFVVIGDAWVWQQFTGRFRLENVEFIDLKVINKKNFSFGKVSAEYGKASVLYLDKAMELLSCQKIDCLVTAPISKEAINKAGYCYSGHTEYFAQKTNKKPIMLLLNEKIRFSLVTRHIPLSEVSKVLSFELIQYTIIKTYQALIKMFAINNPRVVVCGINPHGSDNGLIGTEENRIIHPVVCKLRKKFPGLKGPLGADIAISEALHKNFDAVIAMYHDQALIPLKVLGAQKGVNLTLGLDFVRTSPLHGTAFDIAGKNKANPSSMISAILCAITCCQNLKRA